MRLTSLLRKVPAVAASLAFTVTDTAIGAAPVSADTVADKRAQAARIAEALEEQGRKVSVLSEDLDQARLHADEVSGRARTAEEKLRLTDLRVGEARSRLRGQAVASYVKGGELPAMQAMVAGSSDDLAVRTVYVKEVGGRQQAALEDLRAARQNLESERSQLDGAQRSAKEALGQVESRRRAAEEAAGAQEATLQRVQGELATLVAAAAERRATEEASKAQAELAARQARAAVVAAAVPPPAAPTPGRPPAPRRPEAAPILDQAPEPGAATGRPAAGAEAAIAEARRQLGKPYRWGAAGPDSFDCSGLTLWAWRAGGKSLPHSSRAQFAATSRVPLSQIQPGDLVFYGSPIHHMGIYVGGGTMVEASQTGTPVRYASIYRRDMAGVGRVG